MIVAIGPEPPQAKIGADTVHKTGQHRHKNEDHRDDDQIVQHLRQVGELNSAEQERTGDFEEPTPGYAVFDYSAQYYRNLWGYLHTFSLTFENLTNATYRNHLNRVKKIMPEPGRNLRILHKIFF